MILTLSWRRPLAVLALLGLVISSGCLMTSPTVTADTQSSTVFENISTTEPWASGSVSATTTLNATATTQQGVGKLVVIAADGTTFDSTTLDTGQTSVTLYFPPDQNATVLAVNPINGTVVEIKPVVTNGHDVF